MGRTRHGTGVMLAVALTTAACAGEVSVTSGAASPSRPADTAPDLSSPSPVADHPDAATRAGAAGRQVDCDGPVHLGGWVADFGGPGPAGDARGALDAFLGQELFGLPSTGYERVTDVGDRVLFTYAPDGDAKVAVIVADADADAETGATRGWVVETFATCDPAEYAPASDDELRQTVWTDAGGARVPTSTVTSYTGADHCDWGSVTFLQVHDRQYVRDPEGKLGSEAVAPYEGDASLPDDAVDSGYRHGDRALWLAADGRTAYVVSDDGTEAWPATADEVGCR